jgi:hypothetical protein
MADQTEPNTATQPAPPAPVTFPLEIDVPITFKIRIDVKELYDYYTADNGVNAVADLYDILDDQMFGTVISINGMTPEDIRKMLQNNT